MAEAAASDLRMRLRLMVGYQDAVLVPARAFSGLGPLPGLGSPAGFDARLNLTSRRRGIFERIQATTGMMFQSDQTMPVTFGVRLLTRPGPGGMTFGIEPLFVSGFEVNIASMKLYASRRWDRFFVTFGGQYGVSVTNPEPIFLGALAGGVGVELVDDLLALTVEGGTNLTDRHRAMANVVIGIGAVQVQGGIGVARVSHRNDLGFQAVIAVPFGPMVRGHE